MEAGRLVRSALYPLTQSSVLVAMVVFWILATLAGAAGMFGIWLAIVIVPAVFRYQLYLIEVQATGAEAQPPGAEFFNWFHNVWTLFPAVIAVAAGWAAYATHAAMGTTAMIVVLALCGFVYPAFIGVLAITRSPLQSVNPVALYRFLRASGPSYAIAPAYLLVFGLADPMTQKLWPVLRSLVELFFVFSLHSVIGAIIRLKGLYDDVYLPQGIEPGDEHIRGDIEKERVAALGHAYGFISRDNRKGGFEHIVDAIAKDPEPKAAWAWYFERMLGWENRQHALFFAQHYIRDALQHGEHVAALKALMRCRLVDEDFRPFPDDVPAAIAAAEATRNTELAAVLKRP